MAIAADTATAAFIPDTAWGLAAMLVAQLVAADTSAAAMLADALADSAARTRWLAAVASMAAVVEASTVVAADAGKLQSYSSSKKSHPSLTSRGMGFFAFGTRYYSIRW
jgi:hypothetical protein